MLIETQKKKITNTVWKESLGRRDLLKLVTKEDFAEVAHRKHIEHVGNNSAITTYIAFAEMMTGSAGQQKMMRRPFAGCVQ